MVKEERTTDTFFLKNSIGIFLSRFFVTVSVLIVFSSFSHNLPVSSNGNYLTFYVRFSLLSLITGAGMTMLIYNYSIETVKWLWYSIKLKNKVRYLLFSLLMAGILNALHFNELENTATPLYVLSLTLYFIGNLGSLFTDAVIIISRQIRSLIILNLVFSLCFLSIHLGVLFTGFSLKEIIGWLAVLASLKLIAGVFIIKQVLQQTDITQASVIHFRRIKLFWYALVMFDMSQIVFRQIDKFFITFIVGSAASAIYINGTLEIPFIALVSASISNAALIQLNTRKQENRTLMVDTIKYVSNIMVTFTLSVFFFFLIFRNQFIVFFFSEKYLASVPIFAISLFKLLSYLFTVTFLLKFKHKGKVLNIGALIDISLSLLLVYPLHYLFGLKGIILSFVIGSLSQAVYVGYHAASVVRVRMLNLFSFKKWILKAAVFGGVLYMVKFAVEGLNNNLLQLCLGGATSACIALTWLYLEIYRTKR